MSEYYVKCRKRGAKRFAFLTPKGSLNQLRIHAAVFSGEEKVKSFIAENQPDNPEWEFQAVERT